MFSPIEGGRSINIQGLDCWIPPVGFVVDVKTKKLRKIGVYAKSENIKEQYWERIKPPEWYSRVLKEEDDFNKRKKNDSDSYFNEDYEKYKQQEWDRRLNGFWFMSHGCPVYLVGAHYLFMQHTQIDIGYPKFREPDLEYFYFLQYVIEDPECMGMLEITKRRFGKTYRGGVFVLDYPTRTKMTNGAIQSKTGQDAKKVFAKAVVDPFKKWPRFFKPEYDLSGGVTPKSELRFQNTNVRGKKAEDNLEKEELGSLIDYYSADALATDGQKIHRKFDDEWAKTIECNIYDRHDVTRYCLVDDEGRIIGKVLYSSTVEILDTEKDGVQEAAVKLWNDSDQLKKGENGRTASGLYRFFMTADRAKNFDIYGVPNVEKTIREILADRETVKHNVRSLAARIRKEARTIDEAFSANADKCVFNVVNISSRKKYLNDNPITKRAIWFYRDEEQKVKWRDISAKEKDFHWQITALPPEGQQNKYSENAKVRKPGRLHDGCIAIDGYSNSQGGHKYGSKASAWIGRKYDILDPNNTGKAIGWLYGRPAVKETLHEQVMMAAEYYGYLAWYEHNSDDYLSYFRERGKVGYLGTYPISTIDPNKRAEADRHKGFPTTPFSLTRQVDTGLSYFEHYCDLIDFIELLEDAEKFDPNNRTEFDTTVSFLMLLVCLQEPVSTPQKPKQPIVRTFTNTMATR
jgi:hypothetical protein